MQDDEFSWFPNCDSLDNQEHLNQKETGRDTIRILRKENKKRNAFTLRALAALAENLNSISRMLLVVHNHSQLHFEGL